MTHHDRAAPRRPVGTWLAAALLAVPLAPFVGAAPPAPSTAAEKDRLQKLPEAELRKQLADVPEVPALTLAQASSIVQGSNASTKITVLRDLDPGPLVKARPDVRTLPLRSGRLASLDPLHAGILSQLSAKLRVYLETASPKNVDGHRLDPALLRKVMFEEKYGRRQEWVRPEAVPALTQLLMHEDGKVRALLVDLLAAIDGPASTRALLRLAVFDLSPDVRDAAVAALKKRPSKDVRRMLVSALRYPWPLAAEHAAEALIALDERAAVAQLVTLLKRPDPAAPYEIDDRHVGVRELVRINHRANCLMCHASGACSSSPAAGTDPNFFFPVGSGGMMGGKSKSKGPTFVRVRGDVTYLRQDFSVEQPVTAVAVAPALRFDYLVRTRYLTAKETALYRKGRPAPAESYPQRDAVLFALRGLTGEDHGPTTQAWLKAFPTAEFEAQAEKLAGELVGAPAQRKAAVLLTYKEAKGVVYTQALAVAIPQLKGDIQEQTRSALADRLTRMTVETLRDKLQADEREVRLAAARAAASKQDKAVLPDLEALLEDDDPAVAAAARVAMTKLK